MKLFTIGFTKKSAEIFFSRLKNAGVKRLVDVRLKQTVKMLKVKGNEPQTVEDVRAALAAIIDDMRSGIATVDEAMPIKTEINKRVKEIRAKWKAKSRRTRLRLSYSLVSRPSALHAAVEGMTYQVYLLG